MIELLSPPPFVTNYVPIIIAVVLFILFLKIIKKVFGAVLISLLAGSLAYILFKFFL